MNNSIQLTIGLYPAERTAPDYAALTDEQYQKKLGELKMSPSERCENIIHRYADNRIAFDNWYDRHMRNHPLAKRSKNTPTDLISFMRWYQKRDYKKIETLTAKQMAQLRANGLKKNEDKDHKPVVKLFRATTDDVWLLTHIDPKDKSRAFGLHDGDWVGETLGDPELKGITYGEFNLDAILDIRDEGLFKVEHDPYFKPKFPISVYAQAASEYGNIIEYDALLKRVAEDMKPE